MATLRSIISVYKAESVRKNSTVYLVSRLSRCRFYTVRCNLEAPNVVQLASKARISLTPEEFVQVASMFSSVQDPGSGIRAANSRFYAGKRMVVCKKNALPLLVPHLASASTPGSLIWCWDPYKPAGGIGEIHTAQSTPSNG
eukprot:Gb_37060 [translate_table: standard]